MVRKNRKSNRKQVTTSDAPPVNKSKHYGVLWVAIAGFVAVGAVALAPDSDAADLVVYKDPNCGCCSKWITHMEKAGYDVSVRNRRDVNPIKAEQGVPMNMRSCHTAVVDGYFIEGHVPAEDVTALLTKRPAVKGLTVPGMPLGSPGMEVPGKTPMKYTVYAVGLDGQILAFAKH